MPSGFFALLDDIAYLMDDIATATKITTKKTAVILGDDLAVEAEKTLGIQPDREIPTLIAIIKGSLINKLIILPIMFALEYLIPSIIDPLLLIGGTYLCYEGVENIISFIKKKKKEEKEIKEKDKVRSAILTDFILSLEIIIIAMSSVQEKPFIVQIVSTTLAALFATVGVYGIVVLIVRMDDIGLFLVKKFDGVIEKIGLYLIKLLPKTIKFLSAIGTLAMVLVGGNIYIHSVGIIYKFNQSIAIPTIIYEFFVGLTLGSISFFILKTIKKIAIRNK